MNKKIAIDDILYELPVEPPDNECLFFDKPQKQQMWHRTPFPKNWDILTEQQQVNYIKEDIRKRRTGVWFFNNGKKIYLTGDHWFYLQWWYIAADTDDGYPQFRQSDLSDFYFMDYCWNDPNCYGDMYLTMKRNGKTEKRLSWIYNHTSMTEDFHAGLQSISTKDAKDNLFTQRIVRSFRHMPQEILPVYDGNRDPKSALMFFEPTTRSKKLGKTRNRKALNSFIDFEETSESGYQGRRMDIVYLDEAGSIKDMDLQMWWQTHKMQISLGRKIWGKASLPTTLENMKLKGGRAYLTLWEQSDFNKKDANGRTESGLYRHFNPGWMGYEGFIDEYGMDMVNEEGVPLAKIFLDNARAGASKDKLSQLKRQFPYTVEEAFDIVAGDIFESDVRELLGACRKLLTNSDLPIKRVRLYEMHGNIEYTAKKDDPLAVCVFEEPKANVQYFAGFDGAGSDKETGAEKGSSVSVTVIKGADSGSNCEFTPVAYFKFRPNKMEDAYMITLLLCKWYGKFGKLKIGGERNVGQGMAVISYFINRGAKNLLMRKPKIVGVTNPDDSKSEFWFYRNDGVKELQLLLANRYLRKYCANIPFLELIDSLIDYGKANEDFADSFLAALFTMGDFEKRTVAPTVRQQMRWVKMGLKMGPNGTEEVWEQIRV